MTEWRRYQDQLDIRIDLAVGLTSASQAPICGGDQNVQCDVRHKHAEFAGIPVKMEKDIIEGVKEKTNRNAESYGNGNANALENRRHDQGEQDREKQMEQCKSHTEVADTGRVNFTA